MRAALAFFPKRPRIVYCPHGWAFDRRAPGWELACIRQVERWLSLLTDAVVCVCHDESRRAQAIGISKARLHVVPNGIKDAEILPSGSSAELCWPPDRLKVLFVGRLDAQKGVDVLYAAMQKVGGNAHAIVVGSSVVGGDADDSPPENVQVAGWLSRPRIAGLLAAADVLVMPSRWEAFPFVALEAMRAGVAVIASRVGGLEEIVEDGVTGLLVRSDDPEQLADVLLKVQPQQLHEMGERGRLRYLRLFQAERAAFDLHQVYRSVTPVMRMGRNSTS
jgi:glycosyltransferase involved in cell wall biosynthesis